MAVVILIVIGLSEAASIKGYEMDDNPYRSPEGVPASTAHLRRAKRPTSKRGWLVLVPIGWWIALGIAGVGSDTVTFPVPVALFLTGCTMAAYAILFFATRGWWILLTIPIWLLLTMDLIVLWTWNAP